MSSLYVCELMWKSGNYSTSSYWCRHQTLNLQIHTNLYRCRYEQYNIKEESAINNFWGVCEWFEDRKCVDFDRIFILSLWLNPIIKQFIRFESSFRSRERGREGEGGRERVRERESESERERESRQRFFFREFPEFLGFLKHFSVSITITTGFSLI